MLRAIVLLFLTTAPALWGCVPLDQYSALREAYNKLDAERDASKQASQAAQNNVAKLSGELKRLQQETQDLQARLQQANQQVADLSAQLEAAKKAPSAKEKTDEDRTKQAKEAKPVKPPPKGKKPKGKP